MAKLSTIEAVNVAYEELMKMEDEDEYERTSWEVRIRDTEVFSATLYFEAGMAGATFHVADLGMREEGQSAEDEIRHSVRALGNLALKASPW